MAAVLLRAGSPVYLSTETWKRYLRPWAPRGTAMIVVPIPSTVPRDADPAAVRRWRARFAGAGAARPIVGHFGTFGEHVGRELRQVIPAILHAHLAARFVCVGRGGDVFAASVAAAEAAIGGRIEGTGALPGDEIAAALRACDVIVQPYPDGVTTRRTSVMAALANEVATVTTAGALTERVWSETGAVSLAPASDPEAIGVAAGELLRDRAARSALAQKGREVYDARFAIARTIDTLLQPVGQP
jgi:glycosyltransferase involved in cell wall biosynthesis